MATVVRRFLAIFGVKTDVKELDKYEKSVEDTAKSTSKAVEQTREWSKALANTAALLSGAVLTGVSGLVAGMSESFVNIERWSQAFGIGTDKVQELGFMAESVGLELDDMGDIINTVGERAFDSLNDPASEAAGLFKQMGINVKGANGKIKPSLELLNELADGLQGVESPAERAAISSILLGDVGVKLLPVLQKGSAGLSDLSQEARDLGVVMDAQAAKSVGSFTQEMFLFRSAVKAGAQQLVLQLLPGITKSARAMTTWFKTGGNAKKVTDALVKSLKVLKVIVAAVITAKAIGLYFNFVQAVRTLTLAFKALRVQALLAKAAVLAIPILIAILALALEDFVGWLNGSDSLFGRFIEKFKTADGPLGNIARGLDNLKPALQDLLAQAMAFIPVARKIGQEWLDTALNVILPVVQEIASTFMAFVAEVGPPLITLWLDIQGMAIRTFKRLQSIIKRVIGTIGNLIKVFVKIIVALVRINMMVIGKAINFLIPIVTKLISWLLTAIDVILPWVEKIIDSVLLGALAFFQDVASFVQSFVDTASPIINGFIEGFKVALDAVVPVVVSVFTSIVSVIQTVIAWAVGVKDGFIQFFVGLIDFFVGIGQSILGIFGKVINKILSFFGPLFATMQKAINVANKLGAGININLNAGLKGLQKKITSATDFSAEVSATKAAAGVGVGGTSNTSVGQVNVNISGNPDQTLGANDIANAAKKGLLDAASLKEAERDFASG